MTFRVRFTRAAEVDLERLFEFVLERELARGAGNLQLAEQAIVAIRAGFATLKTSPFTCRKAGQSPFLRELIIPFGRSAARAVWRCSRWWARPKGWSQQCGISLRMTTIEEKQSACRQSTFTPGSLRILRSKVAVNSQPNSACLAAIRQSEKPHVFRSDSNAA